MKFEIINNSYAVFSHLLNTLRFRIILWYWYIVSVFWAGYYPYYNTIDREIIYIAT